MVSDSKNELKRAVTEGRPVFGVNLLSRSPVVMEALGETPIDYVWVDLEHTGPSPYDSCAIERLVRTAETAGIDLLVRVPGTDPEMVSSVLDAGVQNVLLPRITDPAAAEEAVAAARFSSDGPGDTRRGVPLSRSTTWKAPTPDYLERADDEVFVGAMIETVEAAERIDELLSVEGLGFAFLGPADLSVAMGHPLNPAHEEVQRVLDAVRDRALAEDVPLGKITTAPDDIETSLADGFTILRVATDVTVLVDEVDARLRSALSEYA